MSSVPTKADFAQGSVSSLILSLSVPIMAAELVHVLYNLVDRMYIGHMEGEGTVAMTGLGIALPLITLINAFANLFSTGGDPLASIERGKGNLAGAEHIMEVAFTMLLGIGALLTLVLSLAAPSLLALLGGDAQTLPYALDYFRIYVLGCIPVMISLGMNAFINSQGFPKIGMLSVIIGAVLNILLDPLFIYVLDMGVKGAAIATVLSQTASAVWILRFLSSGKAVMRIRRLCFDGLTAGKIVRLGLTGFCFRATNSVTAAVSNIMLKSWGGALSTVYVASMSVINSVREVFQIPLNGISSGFRPVAGYNYGAGRNERVCESISFAFRIMLLINALLWAVIMLCPGMLCRMFSGDESLIRTATVCMRAYFCAFPLMSLQVTGQHCFITMNYPRHALFFSLLRKIFLILPLTLLLPQLGLGVMGVFWAEMISEIVGGTACFTTMYLTIWRKLKKGADIGP